MKLKSSEQGFTLVEILVAIALLAIVAVGVTATIISITSTTQKFTASSTTQNKAADAISSITRNISASTVITAADDYSISVRTAENNQNYDVSVFYWDPANVELPEIADGASTAGLPNTSAIVEFRKLAGQPATTGSFNILTEGYEKARQSQVLFTYYDAENQSITTPIVGTSLDLIKRVEYKFALKVQDRTALIELASSAIPRSATDLPNNGGSYAAPTECLPTVLAGTLAPRSTQANLTWSSINGATGYTIYRENPNQAYNPMVVQTINTHTTTTFRDSTVVKGEKYTYYIITNCVIGNSVTSNRLNLNVTPPAPTFVNLNTTRNLTQTLAAHPESGTTVTSAASVGLRYTVARNLDNQLSWTPANGAEGYKVYRGGSLIATLPGSARTYTDPNRSYGDVTNYVILGTIPTINGSGGDGDQSSPVTLISPPVAPPVTGTALDTSTNTTTTANRLNITTRPANTTGFNAARNTTTSATPSCSASTATEVASNVTGLVINDTSVAWGSATCYLVSGYNDAGSSPDTTVIVNQRPGKFSINSLNETSARVQMNTFYTLDEFVDGNRAGRYNTDYTIGWSASTNHTGNYSVTKVRTDSANHGLVEPGTQTASTTARSVNWNNITPGSQYTFTVQARAANGTTRSVSTLGNTRPTVPIEAHSFIQGRGSEEARRRVAVALWASNGHLTNADGKAWFAIDGEPQFDGRRTANTFGDFYSNPRSGGGDTHGAVRGYLNAWNWEAHSREVRWYGVITAGCMSTCGAADWVDAAERQPDYFAGHHAYYQAF